MFVGLVQALYHNLRCCLQNIPSSKRNESDKVLFPSYPPCMKILCLGRFVAACQLRGEGARPVVAGLEKSITAADGRTVNWRADQMQTSPFNL